MTQRRQFRISDDILPEITELSGEDYSVVDQYVSPGVYRSRKIKRRFSTDFLNFRSWNPATDGTTDCSDEWDDAVAYANSLNRPLYIPGLISGAYFLGVRDITLPKAGLFGDGESSVIKTDYHMSVDQATHIKLINLKFIVGSGGAYIKFIRSKVTIDKVFCNSDGVLANGSTSTFLSGAHFIFEECEDSIISNSSFLNANNSLYFSARDLTNGTTALATRCGQAKIINCHFEHEAHGNFFSYPTGIYAYWLRKCLSIGNTFKNILPGDLGNPSPHGYGEYEGDGGCEAFTSLGCHYKNTEASHSFTGALTSTAPTQNFSNSFGESEHASGGGYLFRLGACAKSQTVANNHASRMVVIVAENGTNGVITITHNKILDTLAGYNASIRIGANSSTVVAVLALGNEINGAQDGGIFFNTGSECIAQENYVKDINKANTTYSAGNNEFIVSGISAYGPTNGRFANNTIQNISGGHAKYGLSCSAGSNNFTDNTGNRFLSMDTANKLNIS